MFYYKFIRRPLALCGVPARVGTHAKQKYIHRNAETKAVFCLYRCRLCGKKSLTSIRAADNKDAL